MARFNSKAKEKTATQNLAGGEAYSESAELELVSILLTSFVKDQFYRKADATLSNLQKLLNQVDLYFAAQAAVYARTKFGMRTISHVVAGELCRRVSGQPWMKKFLNAVVFRPDDILEITSYYDTKKNKETHAMRKGLGAALTRFNEYQLAKYRGEGKAISLVDCVNIYHPRNTPALKKLIKGELRSTETWESKLSRSGKAETEEEALTLKAEAWTSLLTEQKLGYFALLRNLRNIMAQAPDALPLALEQLINPTAIKNSLVLPFRFTTAVDEVKKLKGPLARKTLEALALATELSLDNVPTFEGSTLIAIDESGSMSGKYFDIASLFGAALYKRSPNADIILFNEGARYLTLHSGDSLMTICAQLRNEFRSGGTDFKPIFRLISKEQNRYERIIILSDMQGWIGYQSPMAAYDHYCKALDIRPHVYSIDLAGYGTLQFPENKVYCLAGFSEKIFDVMKLLEQDRHALINEIKRTEFVPAKRGRNDPQDNSEGEVLNA